MSLNTDESTLVIPSIPSLGKRVTFPKSLSAQPPEKHTLNAWDPPNSDKMSQYYVTMYFGFYLRLAN